MDVVAVLSHKLQIVFTYLGPAHLVSHSQPGLLGEPLGIKEDAVHIKDNPLEREPAHTLPMSVRICMSWKEMGLQAA